MKDTLIVNLLGGPGISKSTTAAGVFHELKVNNVDCELVGEFAKDKTWEKNPTALSDQFFVSANQHYKQFILKGQVDVIVTDSPLLIGLFYYKEESPIIANAFCTFIRETFNRQNNLNILLKRKKKFNPNGRNQSEERCREIDAEIKAFLDFNSVDYIELDGDSSCVSIIYDMIRHRIGSTNEIK
jgi:hypothetical protein